MALSDPSLIPKPRRLSRRGWIIAAAVSLLVGTLYVMVAVFYNVVGGSFFEGDPPDTAAGIIVEVEPVAVDAQKDQANVHVRFVAAGPDIVDQSGRLVDNTRVLITSNLGSEEIRYPAGEPLGQKEVVVGLDGEQARYPFDVHDGVMTVQIDTYSKNSDGTFTSGGLVYASFGQTSSNDGWGINGWDTVMTADDHPGSANLALTFTRAFSTKIFAAVLLILVIILSGIALLVGVMVSTRRRSAEIGLMAYAASLLFALPALRAYMPNAPPIGAAIDIYIYLWVIVGAIIAVTLVVTSWIGQSRQRILAERAEAKAAIANQTGD
jgi:hypothetical protein